MEFMDTAAMYNQEMLVALSSFSLAFATFFASVVALWAATIANKVKPRLDITFGWVDDILITTIYNTSIYPIQINAVYITKKGVPILEQYYNDDYSMFTRRLPTTIQPAGMLEVGHDYWMLEKRKDLFKDRKDAMNLSVEIVTSCGIKMIKNKETKRLSISVANKVFG